METDLKEELWAAVADGLRPDYITRWFCRKHHLSETAVLDAIRELKANPPVPEPEGFSFFDSPDQILLITA